MNTYRCRYPGQRGRGAAVKADNPRLAALKYFSPGHTSENVVIVDKQRYKIESVLRASKDRS